MIVVFAMCFVGGLVFLAVGWTQAHRTGAAARVEAALALVLGALLLLAAAVAGSASGQPLA
jgi:hypothetical protein